MCLLQYYILNILKIILEMRFLKFLSSITLL